jgi:hypothetical protein
LGTGVFSLRTKPTARARVRMQDAHASARPRAATMGRAIGACSAARGNRRLNGSLEVRECDDSRLALGSHDSGAAFLSLRWPLAHQICGRDRRHHKDHTEGLKWAAAYP